MPETLGPVVHPASQPAKPRWNAGRPFCVVVGVKTSGLPCRATHDCESVFTLTHQDSMDALREAVARRDAHELEAHGYRHVVTVVPGATPFSQAAVGRRRGRRRSEELTVV